MKIPKKLKIGGYIWDVIYPYEFAERTDRFGFTDVIRKKIYLREVDDGGKKMPEAYIFETLLHEIIHAIDYIYNSTGDLKEETVIGLGRGLYQVLKDNKI